MLKRLDINLDGYKMNTDNPLDFEKLLLKIILQLAIYMRHSDQHLEDQLIVLHSNIKNKLTYPELMPNLLLLSEALTNIPSLKSENVIPHSQELLLKKKFITHLHNLLDEINIPLKLTTKYEQLKSLNNRVKTTNSAEQVINSSLALLTEIKQYMVLEQQEIENFLENTSKELTYLEKKASYVSDSNNESIKNNKQLHVAINQSVTTIKASSSSALSLESLTLKISQHLKNLSQQVIKHQEIESNTHLDNTQKLGEMSQKICKMELEANSLRNKLKMLRNKALTDPLTRLPNRRAYDKRVTVEYSRWYRYKTDLAFIIWDIDLFKNINDTFGHKAGDKTLLLVAQLLLDNCRESDFIARFGGEEFIMLLPHTNVEQAKIMADKLRIIIENSGFNHQGQSIPLTISAGISAFYTNDTIESVFEKSDKALYQAKESGRNRCTIFI